MKQENSPETGSRYNLFPQEDVIALALEGTTLMSDWGFYALFYET